MQADNLHWGAHLMLVQGAPDTYDVYICRFRNGEPISVPDFHRRIVGTLEDCQRVAETYLNLWLLKKGELNETPTTQAPVQGPA